MSTNLSTADVAQLKAAATALLSPSSFESSVAWRQATLSALQPLLGSSRACFAVPVEGEQFLAGEREVVDSLSRKPPDWLFRAMIVRPRELGTNVADWLELFGPDVRRTRFYDEVVRPNRLWSPLSLFAFVAPLELPAIISLYFDRERMESRVFARGKMLLRLLEPALQAGVRALVALGGQRESLNALLERSTDGIAILDVNGGTLFRNTALNRMLAIEPQRDGVRRAIGSAGAAAALTTSRNHKKSSPEVLDCAVNTDARGTACRYSISAVALQDDLSVRGSAAMVIVTRRADGLFAVEDLARRFGLTTREMEALTLFRCGLSTRAIAAQLGVSLNTARRHCEHVLSKLGVHSRAAAIAMLDGRRVDPS